MGRSVKKGPYVEPSLLVKIQALNEKNEKKVFKTAVANAEQQAQRQNAAFDADRLRVRYAVVNEGPTLKRYTQAAMGRATPILKRTSHVEIHVAGEDAPIAPPVRAGTAEAKAGAKAEAIARPVRAGSGGKTRTKRTKAKKAGKSTKKKIKKKEER